MSKKKQQLSNWYTWPSSKLSAFPKPTSPDTVPVSGFQPPKLIFHKIKYSPLSLNVIMFCIFICSPSLLKIFIGPRSDHRSLVLFISTHRSYSSLSHSCRIVPNNSRWKKEGMNNIWSSAIAARASLRCWAVEHFRGSKCDDRTRSCCRRRGCG